MGIGELMRSMYELSYQTNDIVPMMKSNGLNNVMPRHVVRGTLYDWRGILGCTYKDIGLAEKAITGKQTHHSTIINSVNLYRNIIDTGLPENMYMLAMRLQAHITNNTISENKAPEKHIGLVGYARVGKDEVGRILIGKGFRRVAMADHGKSELDSLIRAHFGFSAFTSDDDNKNLIRPMLIAWIDARYDELMNKVIKARGNRSVNTRIYRVKEAKKWIESGGEIWHVIRPGHNPVEPGEMKEIKEMYKQELITHVINNDGDLVDLREKIEDKIWI